MIVLGRMLMVLWICTSFISCGADKKDETKENSKPAKEALTPPTFNSDSSYHYIEQQLAFGPRVPNTSPHAQCAQYLQDELKRFGCEVMVQEFEATAWNNTTLNGKNIIASLWPEKKKRIMLAAHWDTRPYADRDSVDKDSPILGANDGASGVAVLMEMARVMLQHDTIPRVGVDLVLFDVEDYGAPESAEVNDRKFCLGSEYWSNNKHQKNYHAYYGILLDMVGAKDATFTMEGNSMEFAPKIVRKVWNKAKNLGYKNYFLRKKTMGILDDHYYVNTVARIPMIDIIHHSQSKEHLFFQHWHTHRDDIHCIDKNTLQAVGETLLHVLYEE
ncbi:M28 family peptidase [Rapidithrix thailandica]|uniref:M28 family peptidase n=1 Tax=Rapidithrix thailandica TaxID=413964 RepID=A0AAW9RVC8_9BACT